MIAKSGVYIIKNKLTGSFYGGSSVNMKYRWANHKKLAYTGSNKCPHLYSAMRKYGIENFEITPILVCGRDDLELYEQKWLDNNYGNIKCYNASPDAKAPWRGRKMPDDMRKKLSASMRGRIPWNAGIKRTSAEIENIRVGTWKITPPKLSELQKNEVLSLYYDKKCTIKTISALFDVSSTTVQRVVKKDIRHSITERRGGWNNNILGSTCRRSDAEKI